jgi:hypothetical protein
MQSIDKNVSNRTSDIGFCIDKNEIEITIRDFPIKHITCGPPRSQWRTGVRSTEEVGDRHIAGPKDVCTLSL